MTDITTRELICRFCTEPTKNFTDQELENLCKYLTRYISNFHKAKLGCGYSRKIKPSDALDEIYSFFSYKTNISLVTVNSIRRVLHDIKRLQYRRTPEFREKRRIRYKTDLCFLDKTLKAGHAYYASNKEKVLQSQRARRSASQNFDMMKTLLIDMSSVAAQ